MSVNSASGNNLNINSALRVNIPYVKKDNIDNSVFLEPKHYIQSDNVQTGISIKLPTNNKIPSNIFNTGKLSANGDCDVSGANKNLTCKNNENFQRLYSKVGGGFAHRYSGKEAVIALSIIHKDSLRNEANDLQKINLLKAVTYHIDEAKTKEPALYKSMLQGIDKIVDDFKSRGKIEKFMDYIFVEMANTGVFLNGMNDWGARKIIQNPTLLNHSSTSQKVDLLNSMKRFYTNNEEQECIIKVFDNAIKNGGFKDLLAGWSDNLNMAYSTVDVLYKEMSGKNATDFLKTVREGIKKENISDNVMKELYGGSKVLSDLKLLASAEKMESSRNYYEAGQLYSSLGDTQKAKELFENAGYQNMSNNDYTGVVKSFVKHSFAHLKETYNDSAKFAEQTLAVNWGRTLATISSENVDNALKDFPILQAKNVLNLREEREAKLETLSKIEVKELSPQQKVLHNRMFEKKIDILTGTKAHTDNNIKMLLDGPDAHERIKQRIEGSKESIFIEVFLWHDDKIGHEIADSLIKKANEGLDVRVVVDGPSNAAHGSVLKKLKNSKVKFEKYAGSFDEPIKNRGMVGYHRKLYIFDKQYAMTGGINIGEHYLKKDKWHDLLVEVQGSVMSDTLNNFYKMWSFSSGQPLEKAPPPSSFKQTAENPKPGELSFDAKGSVRLITTDPTTGDKDIRTWMLEAINNAHTRVMIQDPYFNDPDIVEALKGAVDRKVKVDVIFPNSNDVPIMKHLDDNVLDVLYAAGANVHSYNTSGKENFNHLKATIVDDMVSIGSSNKDVRAMNTNQEINYVINDKEFTEQIVKKVFEVDIKNSVPAKPDVDNVIKRLIKLALNEVPSLF